MSGKLGLSPKPKTANLSVTSLDMTKPKIISQTDGTIRPHPYYDYSPDGEMSPIISVPVHTGVVPTICQTNIPIHVLVPKRPQKSKRVQIGRATCGERG